MESARLTDSHAVVVAGVEVVAQEEALAICEDPGEEETSILHTKAQFIFISRLGSN